MTLTVSYSATFLTEEGSITRPDRLVLTISANDEGFRIYGVNRRSRLIPADITGVLAIPFALLGYPDLTALEQATGLKQRTVGELPYTPITFDTPAELPDQMVETTNFVISEWDDTDYTFNLAVSTPPSAPDTITGYLLTIDENPFWSLVVDAGDAASHDFEISPDTYDEWPFGVGEFQVSFRIRAMIDAGHGPASDPELRMLDIVDITYVDAADWDAISITTVGPEGLIDITLNAGSGWTGFAGWELRTWAGDLPAGADPSTLLPVDWATTANTAPIAVGQTVRFATGLVEDDTAYSAKLLYQAATGEFELATVRKTTAVLALGFVDKPVLISQAITGLVDHNGTLRADIGVPLTGDAVWTNTNGSPARRNRFEINLVAVGSLANDAAAAFTPVAGNNGKTLTLKSDGLKDGQQVSARSAAYTVVYPRPTAVGTLADQTYSTSDGAKTIAGATVLAAFAGSALVLSIQSSIATINSSTGEITFPEQTSPLIESVTVTAANSGGSATQTFTLTFQGGIPGFPGLIPDDRWLMAEVIDETEAGGVVGKRKLTWPGTVTVPAGFTLHFYGGTTTPPAWSASNAAVIPGTPFTTSGGLAVGSTVYPRLGWRRLADGAFQTASQRPSFTIVGFGIDEPTDDWPAFPAEQFTQATDQALTRYSASLNGGTNAGWFGSAAVVEGYEGMRGNAAADSHILNQLRSFLNGANCPLCDGGFGAQMELRFVVVAALAKLNARVSTGVDLAPALDVLTAAEKIKIDLLVKGMLVSGAYCCSTKNPDIAAKINKARNLRSRPLWWGTNPNFSCAPPAIVHSAVVFLGLSTALNFLDNLNINDFKAQLLAQDLTNAYTTFNGLLATGTFTGEGGASPLNPTPSIPQVQNAVKQWVCATPDFTGQTMASSHAAAIAAMERCFNKNIKSGLGGNEGNGWIGPGIAVGTPPNTQQYGLISANAAGLPNKGLLGMAMEFETSDGPGQRSALTPYVMYGTRVVLDMLTALAAGGMLNRNDSAFQTAVARMHRGMTDTEYKSINGYRQFEKGKADVYVETNTGANGGLSYCARIGAGSPRKRGYTFGHWFDVLHPWLQANTQSAAHPATVVNAARLTTILSRIAADTPPQSGASAALTSYLADMVPGGSAQTVLGFTPTPQNSYSFASAADVADSRNSFKENGRPLAAAAWEYLRKRVSNPTLAAQYADKAVEIIEAWTTQAPNMVGNDPDGHPGLHLGSHLAFPFMQVIDKLRGYPALEAALPPFKEWWYDECVSWMTTVLTAKMNLSGPKSGWRFDNWVDAAIGGRLMTAIAFDDAPMRIDSIGRLTEYFVHGWSGSRYFQAPWGNPSPTTIWVVRDDVTRNKDNEWQGSGYTAYGQASAFEALQSALHCGTNLITPNRIVLAEIVNTFVGWQHYGVRFNHPTLGDMPNHNANQHEHGNIIEFGLRHFPDLLNAQVKSYATAHRPFDWEDTQHNFACTLANGEIIA